MTGTFSTSRVLRRYLHREERAAWHVCARIAPDAVDYDGAALDQAVLHAQYRAIAAGIRRIVRRLEADPTRIDRELAYLARVEDRYLVDQPWGRDVPIAENDRAFISDALASLI